MQASLRRHVLCIRVFFRFETLRYILLSSRHVIVMFDVPLQERYCSNKGVHQPCTGTLSGARGDVAMGREVKAVPSRRTRKRSRHGERAECEVVSRAADTGSRGAALQGKKKVCISPVSRQHIVSGWMMVTRRTASGPRVGRSYVRYENVEEGHFDKSLKVFLELYRDSGKSEEEVKDARQAVKALTPARACRARFRQCRCTCGRGGDPLVSRQHIVFGWMRVRGE